MPDASTARRAAGAAPLSLGAGPPVIGFDVGGTLIKAGWVDGTGAVSGVVRVPTPVLDDGAVDGLLDALDDLDDVQKVYSNANVDDAAFAEVDA